MADHNSVRRGVLKAAATTSAFAAVEVAGGDSAKDF
jgi:uncharacterized protein (DUF2236 family)